MKALGTRLLQEQVISEQRWAVIDRLRGELRDEREARADAENDADRLRAALRLTD